MEQNYVYVSDYPEVFFTDKSKMPQIVTPKVQRSNTNFTPYFNLSGLRQLLPTLLNTNQNTSNTFNLLDSLMKSLGKDKNNLFSLITKDLLNNKANIKEIKKPDTQNVIDVSDYIEIKD